VRDSSLRDGAFRGRNAMKHLAATPTQNDAALSLAAETDGMRRRQKGRIFDGAGCGNSRACTRTIKTQRDPSTPWRRIPTNGMQEKAGRRSAQDDAGPSLDAGKGRSVTRPQKPDPHKTMGAAPAKATPSEKVAGSQNNRLARHKAVCARQDRGPRISAPSALEGVACEKCGLGSTRAGADSGANRPPSSVDASAASYGPVRQRNHSQRDEQHKDSEGKNDDCRSPETEWVCGAVITTGRAAFVIALSRDEAIAGPPDRGKSQHQKHRALLTTR
jgi:hypothetical protein